MTNDEIYIRDLLAIGAAGVAYYRAESRIEAGRIPHQDLRAVFEARDRTRDELFSLCVAFDAAHREKAKTV
jgi:hypothetical protein